MGVVKEVVSTLERCPVSSSDLTDLRVGLGVARTRRGKLYYKPVYCGEMIIYACIYIHVHTHTAQLSFALTRMCIVHVYASPV